MNQQKLAMINQELVALRKLGREKLEKTRELTNEAFFEVIAKKTHDVIENKENEIQKLHEKLKEFQCSSQDTSYDLKYYDQELKRAEMRMKRCQENIENFKVPELIKKEYIEKITDLFNKKMDSIESIVKKKVENNNDNFKEVFEEVVSIIEDIINILVNNIEFRYNDISYIIEDQHKCLEEAYERQIKLMNDKINLFIKCNSDLEKEK